MEDRHKNDITINSILLFHHLKQKDPILLWVCTTEYPYIIQQTGNENTQTYHEVFILI